MDSKELRKIFLEFFKEKGHAIVPSSSLIPTDPSVLLTTAGMQQFKRYYTGELDAKNDFGEPRTASIQKCFRTSDIEEVGDKTHLTFFEMLGNFAFGDYYKKDAIRFAYAFVTEAMGISQDRIYVTVFKGEGVVPKDEESYAAWHELGFPKEKIRLGGMEDNFWGPTGSEGPCGPTTEIYVDGVEVWNVVFNGYVSNVSRDELLKGNGELTPLSNPGVDTGMGFERLMSVLGGTDNVFETDLLHPLFSEVLRLAPGLNERVARIVTDHLRASVFLIADGVRPSNKEAGYILRRLLRRILAYQTLHDVHPDLFPSAVEVIVREFGKYYPELQKEKEIVEVLEAERVRFHEAIVNGLKTLAKTEKVSGEEAFYLYETFGLPFELVKEFAPEKTKELRKEDFDRAFEAHQALSRAGAEKKFGGHGLIMDTGELKAGNEDDLKKAVRLHTATHLLQKALREVLGDEVKQAGSDITPERTRFDFTFPRKVTPEELKKVEELVNKIIAEDLPVAFVEMSKEDAEKTGALFFFKQKYPAQVKVYYVGHSLGDAWSKEFCGGPHVSHTGEVGKFKILKEEAVGAGVRRIRGVIE